MKILKISKLTEICSTFFFFCLYHPQEQPKETKMLKKLLSSWDHRQAMGGRARDGWTRNAAGKLPWWGSKLCLRFRQLPGRVSERSVWGRRALTLGISPRGELIGWPEAWVSSHRKTSLADLPEQFHSWQASRQDWYFNLKCLSVIHTPSLNMELGHKEIDCYRISNSFGFHMDGIYSAHRLLRMVS